MQFSALATDYDGTLATEGQVNASTLDALRHWRETGRKLLLVTGRHLDDLISVFPSIEVFDIVIAENGALLYFPATQTEQILGDRPPEAFIQALQAAQVQPLDRGRVIVSTWQPHDTTVLRVIRELNLELQVILNKGAVMVLPSDVNKATGLAAALERLNLTPAQTVAVGDAENDQAFLDQCGFSVAVANALPAVKQKVDWVTQAERGEGVTELIDRLVASPSTREIPDGSIENPAENTLGLS